MKYLIIAFIVVSLFVSSFVNVYAQQPQLATYREVAQVLVDQQVQNMTTAFVTLSSTSPLEIHVPTILDEKIRNVTSVSSVVITNANACVPGVTDQGCVLVNIIAPSLIETYNLTKIQTIARATGDSLIDDINKGFAINAQFDSVYVHPSGALSNALGTSGVVEGNRTISVAYTMSKPDSSYLYDSLTTILLAKQIRNAGGFYDVAKQMAQDQNSTVTFAITPTPYGQSIYQLQVSQRTPIKNEITSVRPLDLFGVPSLQRSLYFSGGFFPLNSIFELSVLSKHDISITSNGASMVPTRIVNGTVVPADFTKAGWIFDPGSGQAVTAIYLFGTTTSVTGNDLAVTLSTASQTPPVNGSSNPSPQIGPDYSIYVIIGIVVAGAAAVYLFMKRR